MNSSDLNVKDDLNIYNIKLGMYNNPITYFSTSDDAVLKENYYSTVAKSGGIPEAVSPDESVSSGKLLNFFFSIKGTRCLYILVSV